MPGELSYTLDRPFLIPLHTAVQRALVWTGNDVLLTSLATSGKDKLDPELTDLRAARERASQVTAELIEMDRAMTSRLCVDPPQSQYAESGDVTGAHCQTPWNKPRKMTDDATCKAHLCPLSRISTIDAMKWLSNHYEQRSSMSLPRGAVYSHYLDNCHQALTDPMNPASFGKLIRSVFPTVRTRRLGTRGQSKYHYYGLTVKDTSPYKSTMPVVERDVNPCSPVQREGSPANYKRKETMNRTSSNSQSEAMKMTSLLPDFPSPSNTCLPLYSKDKVSIYLLMYKHHAYKLLSTVLQANFTQVRELVRHFWISLPCHILSILADEHVIRLTAMCDVIVYNSLTHLLVPCVTQQLPASLLTVIRKFGSDMLRWKQDAMKSMPPAYSDMKLKLVHQFNECLNRRTVIVSISEVARGILQTGDSMKRLRKDWRHLDVEMVVRESAAVVLGGSTLHAGKLTQWIDEFTRLLDSQGALETYMEWLRKVAEVCVFKLSEKRKVPWEVMSRKFMLRWNYVIKIIMREITVQNNSLFGTFHILGMLFTDYLAYLFEQKKNDEYRKELEQRVYSIEHKTNRATTLSPTVPPQVWNNDVISPGNSPVQTTHGFHDVNSDEEEMTRGFWSSDDFQDDDLDFSVPVCDTEVKELKCPLEVDLKGSLEKTSLIMDAPVKKSGLSLYKKSASSTGSVDHGTASPTTGFRSCRFVSKHEERAAPTAAEHVGDGFAPVPLQSCQYQMIPTKQMIGDCDFSPRVPRGPSQPTSNTDLTKSTVMTSYEDNPYSAIPDQWAQPQVDYIEIYKTWLSGNCQLRDVISTISDVTHYAAPPTYHSPVSYQIS